MTQGQVWPIWLQERLNGQPPGHGVAKVLKTLISEPRAMSYATAATAAQAAGVNPATVVRTAQLLSFNGWPALRAEVRSRYLASLSASEVLSEHDDPERPAQAALGSAIRNLQELTPLLDERQIAHIADLLAKARVSVVIGSGSILAPGQQLTHLGQTIGHDMRLQQAGGTSLVNAAALLQPGDALVIFHLWRSPRAILNAAKIAVDKGASLIVVADQAHTQLTATAAEVVMVPSEGPSMFPSLVGAITVVQAIIGALVARDPKRAARNSDRVEALWETYDMFPEDQLQ